MTGPEPDDGKGASEMWRELRDSYMDAFAKVMTDAVNSDAYAKTTGAMLDACLSASSPFRQAIEKAMLATLEQLSMPSRADFVSLAERLTNVEMRLDDMDAKLDQIVQALAKPQSKAPAASSPRRRGKKGSQ
jgi:hypothetical protein